MLFSSWINVSAFFLNVGVFIMIAMLLVQVLYYGGSTFNYAYVCRFFCMSLIPFRMQVYQPFSNFISENRNFNGTSSVSNLYAFCTLFGMIASTI